MIIERGNTRLVRLTEDKTELVRNWRNDPSIQQHMEYRAYITPGMQKEWFRKINNHNNNYFLIETQKEFIGLISASDIDWENNITNNGGIFIWDENSRESPVVLNAALLLTDMGFLMGMKKNYVRILNDNKKSIAFNQSLGYTLLPEQNDTYNQKYELTAENYFSATEKIRTYFGIADTIKLIGTKDEYNQFIEFAKKIEKAEKNYHQHIKVEFIFL